LATKSKSKALVKADKELSADEYTFCEQYLKDGNAARSARKIGYEAHVSRNRGKELLAKTYIKRYLRLRRKEIAVSVKIGKDTLLHKLCEIASANMLDFYDPETLEMIDIKNVPNAGAIKKLKLVPLNQRSI